MKTRNVNVLIGAITLSLLAFAGVYFLLIPLAVAGISMATGTIVSETVTTETVKAAASTLDRDYVSKQVLKMKPSLYPLDTIMREVGTTIDVKSWKTQYYATDVKPFTDTVTSQYSTNNERQASLVVDNITMWNVDDTILVQGVEGTDGFDVVLFIAAKTTATSTLTVQALNAAKGSNANANYVVVPTIPADTVLTRMAPAKSELDAQHTPYAAIPEKEYNYLQIFMAQVEEGAFQAMHDKEANWTFQDYEELNIYDMRGTMELSGILGYRAVDTDLTDNDLKYFTGGITRTLTKSLEYGNGDTDRTINNDTWVNWTKEIFTGNSGADSRIVFGGSGLNGALHLVDNIAKQLESKNTEVKWGIRFKVIETNFGTLFFKHHGLLDYAGWTDKGIVLDINNIEKHVWVPMTVKKLDLKTSGQRNADATVLTETSCLVARYSDTHAIIAPKA